MALQSECHVTVTESRQHQLSPDSASPTQILTLRVDSINLLSEPLISGSTLQSMQSSERNSMHPSETLPML
ncbi:hypothetical protein FQN60_018668 [Etheostoma spectabile]|uniref:Uncharacterized protein n=1 Tax=Etheostoma spectabile TaxID=54343 RepID=A0A5J5CGG7_9PERO|nr:hypothetical protein FQN60_018668 [Etheostoma spectabile]